MVLVDIYVPIINETYDFELDENVMVEEIIEAVVDIIGRQMKSDVSGQSKEFSLYLQESTLRLKKNCTLHMNGVRDGSRLMLI